MKIKAYTIKVMTILFCFFITASFAKSEVIKLKCKLKVEENDLLAKKVKTFNETKIYTVSTYKNLNVPFLIGSFKEKECKKEGDGQVMCTKEILNPYSDADPIGNKQTIVARINRNTGELTWWTSEHLYRSTGSIVYVLTSREGLCEKFLQKKIF